MASALAASWSLVSGCATRSCACCCCGVGASCGRGSGIGCGGGTVSSGTGIGSATGGGRSSSFSDWRSAWRAADASDADSARLASTDGSPAAASVLRSGDHSQAPMKISATSRCTSTASARGRPQPGSR
ncbi:hypothetical protein G6F35_015862 [Rhizopus arrhizus]|nr:hypothetical protein G6F35_015862 [Rhizopus arrhizus]